MIKFNKDSYSSLYVSLQQYSLTTKYLKFFTLMKDKYIIASLVGEPEFKLNEAGNEENARLAKVLVARSLRINLEDVNSKDHFTELDLAQLFIEKCILTAPDPNILSQPSDKSQSGIQPK